MGYRDYSTAKGHIVDATGHGDFTTISAAITAAASGQTIFIRPGTYTENPTLKPGVNLVAFNPDQTGNVTISGTCTFTTAGVVTISGINLQTNGSFLLSVTGSADSVVELLNCGLTITNNTAINYTSSSSSSGILLEFCNGNIAASGIAIYSMSSTGTIAIRNCQFGNGGGSTTPSSNSAGTAALVYSTTNSPIACSGTGVVNLLYGNFSTTGLNVTALDITGSGTSAIEYSDFISGTASAISVGAGATLNILSPIRVDSTNTNAITGAGAINYSVITHSNTSSNINVTTQTPYATSIGNPVGFYTFSSYLSAPTGNVTGDSTLYNVIFDTVVTNPSGAYNNSTGVFTAPVAGLYLFTSQIAFVGGAADSNNFIIIWDGSAYNARAYQYNPVALPAQTNILSAAVIIEMAAGDGMKMGVIVAGTSLNIAIFGSALSGPLAVASTFSGYKLG